MNIPSQSQGSFRSPLTPAGSVRAPQSNSVSQANGQSAPVQASDKQVSTPRPDPTRTSERVDKFADKVQQRLEALAEETGRDLSEIEAQFGQDIERLQNAIADGSLDRADLQRGVENILGQLRGSVAEEFAPTRESESNREQLVDRAENFASGLENRVQNLVSDLRGQDAQGVGLAAGALEGHVDRLIAGIQDGSLSGDEIAQGVQGVIANLTQNVGRGLGLAEPVDQGTAPTQDEPAGLEVHAERFENFVSKTEERLAAIEVAPEDARAFEQFKMEFGSAMDRLGSAVFDKGSIDARGFHNLFQGLMQDLSADAQEFLGGASLYDASAGLESLGGSIGSLDATA